MTKDLAGLITIAAGNMERKRTMPMLAEHRKRWDAGERKQQQLDALRRAEDGDTATNYPAIYGGFMDKGIPESEIRPRENVFTFNAWKAKGRSVKKGEHGVRVMTFFEVKDKDTGEITGRRPATTVVFHVSQTEATSEAEARWRAKREARAEAKAKPEPSDFGTAARDLARSQLASEPKPEPKPANGNRWIES
jgi:hypothetical protein